MVCLQWFIFVRDRVSMNAGNVTTWRATFSLSRPEPPALPVLFTLYIGLHLARGILVSVAAGLARRDEQEKGE